MPLTDAEIEAIRSKASKFDGGNKWGSIHEGY